MSAAFHVDISPPKQRGMTLTFSAGDQHFSQNFSTQAFPFLDDIIRAVQGLRHGYVDARIVLFLGAPECDLHLQADAGSSAASLRIILWPDHSRSKFARTKMLFAYEATRSEIVGPFVAGLRRLRDSVGDSEFLQEYGSPFPKLAYDQLIAG